MKRKIDTNKIYSFIGQVVVYGTMFLTFVGFITYGLINNTIVK